MRGLLTGEAGGALQVGGKAGAALGQQSADVQGLRRKRSGQERLVDRLLGQCVGQPVGGFADVEGDGRGIGWDDAPGSIAIALRPCRMRRDAAPANGAGEAELVEPGGRVVGDTGREQGALPLDGRGLVAFELVQGFEYAFFAGEVGLRSDVLPAEQPAHVDGGRDGLHLLARGGECEPVDALQDAALAPLNVVRLLGGRELECAAQEQALHLHGEEGLKDSGGIERKACSERRGSGGAGNL